MRTSDTKRQYVFIGRTEMYAETGVQGMMSLVSRWHLFADGGSDSFLIHLDNRGQSSTGILLWFHNFH